VWPSNAVYPPNPGYPPEMSRSMWCRRRVGQVCSRATAASVTASLKRDRRGSSWKSGEGCSDESHLPSFALKETSIASPDGRILRIEDAVTTPDVDRRNQVVVSKPCLVPGCTGTMHFYERLTVADALHTLEWPWYASWRCAQDSAHFQLLSRAEEREIIGRRGVT
jgi:hypothetical protein